MFAHKDDKWGWTEWDRFFESYSDEDVCILLKDLFVLDFDDVGTA